MRTKQNKYQPMRSETLATDYTFNLFDTQANSQSTKQHLSFESSLLQKQKFNTLGLESLERRTRVNLGNTY